MSWLEYLVGLSGAYSILPILFINLFKIFTFVLFGRLPQFSIYAFTSLTINVLLHVSISIITSILSLLILNVICSRLCMTRSFVIFLMYWSTGFQNEK